MNNLYKKYILKIDILLNRIQRRARWTSASLHIESPARFLLIKCSQVGEHMWENIRARDVVFYTVHIRCVLIVDKKKRKKEKTVNCST